MANPDADNQTQLRLLKAAGEIFAEQGFRQATVRDIIQRAGVNIAAVNYHFRDKLGLYVAVLKHWLGAAMEKYPSAGGAAPDAPAEVRLDAFVRSFLHRLLDEGVPAWHGKLMAREMADPTPGVLEMIVQAHFQPHARVLFDLLGDLLGRRAAPEQMRLCAFSIVGQCLFYRHCQPALQLMAPEQELDAKAIAQIAAHVTRFSLAGIDAVRGAPARLRRKRHHGKERA